MPALPPADYKLTVARLSEYRGSAEIENRARERRMCCFAEGRCRAQHQ